MSIPPYSEIPPTVAGWYWRRAQGNEVVVHLDPKWGSAKHWRDLRRQTCEAKSLTPSERAELLMAPDNSWRVEWAGPIPNPPLPKL